MLISRLLIVNRVAGRVSLHVPEKMYFKIKEHPYPCSHGVMTEIMKTKVTAA